ncbi:TetR/AcrR family transcriptional regulator [Paenibacillus ehimensis]|uniref:TetR/AcrR family transcriptional regulator n=1 Tax=Paenibacillus ehimensis TaxID=79264 RepID=A0ABT8V8L7_9BACL|nr:TetR/AcrR family transcriptional regulator [Paenibacillus ehimensis]MDO3676804.1 TetR/AcrR family transcriptional regulator [Paenibacillus ehimensis]MEC0210390.1 TetR/AcrR family transcriptional regulator [Paenibacillus ehimensis]
MRKGELTKEQIIQKSAALFNQQGYNGVSLNDITEMTGIKRGGLYRHFASKDEIALLAYDYASEVVRDKFLQAQADKQTAKDKLLSFFEVYADVVHNPPFTGGCPMLNTAVECDDGHRLLREKAQTTFRHFYRAIQEILEQGIQNGEFRSDLNIESTASFLISALEGSIVLSKLEENSRHVRYSMENMAQYLELIGLKN